MTEYIQKRHKFDPEYVWSITPQGVMRQSEGSPDYLIPFSRIQSVRLRQEPTRVQPKRVGFHIYTPQDHVITNEHYIGIYDFEDRTQSFENFLDAFHSAFPKDTDVTFHKGSTQGAFIGNIAIILAVFLLLFAVSPLFAVTGIPGASFIVKILLLIVYLPIALRMIWKNKPQRYDPQHWPRDMLP